MPGKKGKRSNTGADLSNPAAGTSPVVDPPCTAPPPSPDVPAAFNRILRAFLEETDG